MNNLGLRQAYRRLCPNKIGYTLVELLTVLSIVLILSSIGMFVYTRAIAYAKDTVCQTNLNTLKTAVELYATENDALPASLGQLKLEHLEKAYARAMEDRRWVTKLAFFLVKLDSSDHAHAQFLTYENLKRYGASEGMFHCPSDLNGGASYGINGNLVGRRWSDVGRDELLIADSDHYVFTTVDQLSKRHRNKAFAIKKGGILMEVSDEGIKNITGGDDDGKVTICKKPGTPAEGTITVSTSSLKAHLDQGATLGACPEQ